MMLVPKLKIILALLGLLALFAAGLALRRIVLQSQYALVGQVLPFNMESALEFRYVRMLFDGIPLPKVDKKIQAPAGVVVRQTYTIGAEYVYAWAAKLFPGSMALSERVRWVAVGWFCLGIPLLSLWLWAWLKSAWAAGIGGAYYAVSLASVMRSTGQELSHENFALPLLLGHLALAALASAQTRGRMFGILALVSAVLLGWALASWDMIQYYVAVWAVFYYIRMVGGRFFEAPRHRMQWGLILLVLVMTGLFNPYLRAHGFVTSPAMGLAYGTGIGILLQQAVPGWRGWSRGVTVALAALIPLGLFLFAGMYAAAYGHFGELLWAKLLFLNQKPADPALLTFAQRILWTPALHSANWQLTMILFPATLPLFVLTIAIICCQAHWRSNPELIYLLGFCGLSFLAFILFVRFHVFLIITMAALLGWTAFWACPPADVRKSGSRPPRRWRSVANIVLRGIVILLLLAGVGVEAGHVLRDPARWGRAPAYLSQKQELIQWLKTNHVAGPVLANFGISAFMLTYADCSIVLHPKFESSEIRRRVQTYGEALFRSDAARFRDWAERHGAVWFVYSLGEFAAVHPELQMRYCVNALQPPPNAAARMFEYQPDRMRYFQWLWGNPKYRVYRIIRRADERQAARYAGEARENLARGDLNGADVKASLALLYDPHAVGAQKVLLHVGSLREKGIR